jgi:GNAT superfamily N-acetyltransferase
VQEAVHIRCLQSFSEREIHGLSDVLIDCVEGGASVSFMLPMPQAKAEAYWRRTALSAERGELRVFTAEDAAGMIIGTVQLLLDQPENQPHRGDIAKMLVHRRARRRGVGAALLAAAEGLAASLGKTLLVLDTASADAERLYSRGGWQLCGQIPDYALYPDGRPCATKVFFKFLTVTSADAARSSPDRPVKVDPTRSASGASMDTTAAAGSRPRAARSHHP